MDNWRLEVWAILSRWIVTSPPIPVERSADPAGIAFSGGKGKPKIPKVAFVCLRNLRVKVGSSSFTLKFLSTPASRPFHNRLEEIAMAPPHLMSLADLSINQINRSLAHAARLKRACKPILQPNAQTTTLPSNSLHHKSIALLFSKRSTRTRVSAETAAALLGGRALFLGKEDIQLGVNESPSDTAKVIGSMCQGIFARVGEHEEIEVR